MKVPGVAAKREFRVEADSDVRLDSLVAVRAEISRTAAATLIANGHVLVDGRREKSAYRPRAGEQVTVEVPAPPLRTVEPEDIPLEIAWKDEDVVVVDKPAGMVVHPAPGHWQGTLVNALLGGGGPLTVGGVERAGLVHRLDKETSGLLVVARNDRSVRALGAALAQRRIERRYAALCWGHMDDDAVTIDSPLDRDPRNRKRMAVVAGGRPARTTFRRLCRFQSVDLLRARLHTGRTHQIRVHLASRGHPVVGDDVYGGGGGRRLVDLPSRRMFLHAAWLRFPHPVTGVVIDVRAPLPADLRRSLAAVAGEPQWESEADVLSRLGFFDLTAEGAA